MNIAFADTVIPTPFLEDTRAVRLRFDFEDEHRKLTPEEFWEFCSVNRKLNAELTKDGEVIIMAPTGFNSSEMNSEINYQLQGWARKDATGTTTDSNGAYVLQNGAAYAPDAAWISNARLEKFTPEERRKFLPVAPDFVIELLSPSDSLAELQAKMLEWIENGVRLGWLIDPQRNRVLVYSPNQETGILENPEKVSGDEVLPGFELHLREIW
jgi:Uma2 family endonuclease